LFIQASGGVKMEQEYRYDIESLLPIFQAHALDYESQMPQLDGYNFNLPQALCTICQEIIEIKKEINSISDDINGYDP
jgi:hypothetical protein